MLILDRFKPSMVTSDNLHLHVMQNSPILQLSGLDLHVFQSYFVKSSVVNLILPQCSLNVPSMFPQCSLHVPSMFPPCSLHVPLMFPQGYRNVHSLFPECSLDVPWVFPQCPLNEMRSAIEYQDDTRYAYFLVRRWNTQSHGEDQSSGGKRASPSDPSRAECGKARDTPAGCLPRSPRAFLHQEFTTTPKKRSSSYRLSVRFGDNTYRL